MSTLPDPTATGPCQVQATFLCTQEAAGERLIPTSMLPDSLIPGPLYAPMCLPCYEHLADAYLTALHKRRPVVKIESKGYTITGLSGNGEIQILPPLDENSQSRIFVKLWEGGESVEFDLSALTEMRGAMEHAERLAEQMENAP